MQPMRPQCAIWKDFRLGQSGPRPMQRQCARSWADRCPIGASPPRASWRLGRAGWDGAAQGLIGAPRVVVIAGEEVHVTVQGALRLLGLGDACVNKVKTDGQGRMLPDAVRDALRAAEGSPTIVSTQAGNVNTGSFDPLADIARLARAHGNSWVHVDGAFGLWASASPRFRHLVEGVSAADSWAT